MSLSHSPSIVTNGLVLYLDAANTKSYPGTGTTWSDLSGNNNTGTLTNGPTYSSSNKGSIVFDGTNDYIATSGIADSFWQSDWTASFWVNFDTLNTSSGTSDKTLLQHGSAANNRGLHLCQRNSRIHFGLFADDIQGVRVLSTGTWYNIVFTLNNTTRLKQIYINGVLDNSATGTGSYLGTGSNTRICGVVLTFGLTLDGFMPSCVLYSRVLSAEEINQNFNALRGRYGI